MRLLGVLALALLLAPPAHASDSAGSSDGSGAASGDSAGASGDSADASGNSADSSANSSDPGQSSAQSSEDSLQASSGDAAGASLATTLTGSASSTIAGGIVLTVVLARNAHKDAPVDPASEASALLRAGLVAQRRDVGMLLQGLTTSPVLFDALAREAAAGGGPQIAAVSRTLRAPPTEVARAFVATRDALGAPRDDADAARFALRFLRAVGPAMDDDPLQAGAVLWQLARERRDPAFPATSPAHAQLARWMGVPVDVVVAATADLPDRAGIYDAPLPTLDGLADAIAARAPEAVHDRVAALVARSDAP